MGRLCHLWPVCSVKYGPGGRHLAAAGLGGQLCIWEMTAANAKLELQVTYHAQWPSALSLYNHPARSFGATGCTVHYVQRHFR